MKNKILSLLLMGILVVGLTGCGTGKSEESQGTTQEETQKETQEKQEETETNTIIGSWSGESSNNQFCTLTFEKGEKYNSECTGVFNKVYEFSGTYKISGNIVTITSDETGKVTKYEYEIKEAEGLLKKRLSLIGIDTSVSYEEFDYED